MRSPAFYRGWAAFLAGLAAWSVGVQAYLLAGSYACASGALIALGFAAETRAFIGVDDEVTARIHRS